MYEWIVVVDGKEMEFFVERKDADKFAEEKNQRGISAVVLHVGYDLAGFQLSEKRYSYRNKGE